MPEGSRHSHLSRQNAACMHEEVAFLGAPHLRATATPCCLKGAGVTGFPAVYCGFTAVVALLVPNLLAAHGRRRSDFS